jgi:hypothetical protein
VDECKPLNAGYARDAQLAQLAQLDSLAAAQDETHTRRAGESDGAPGSGHAGGSEVGRCRLIDPIKHTLKVPVSRSLKLIY